MEYNYQNYLKLLKENDELLKQNKSLQSENKLKYVELNNYSRQINDHIHWSHKNQYRQLIEDFISFKINGQTFDAKFCKMIKVIEQKWRLLTKDYQKLKSIKPNPISYNFADYTGEIYLLCDEFYPDFDPNDPPDFSFARDEENFRNAVADILPLIQEYYQNTH